MSTPEQSPDVEDFTTETPAEVEAPREESAPVEEAPAPAPVVPGRPVQTVGRRKEAVVRVRLVPGTGNFRLNGKDLPVYFPNKVHQQLVKEPLVITEQVEKYDVLATLHGGGISGQAGALRLGIARALIVLNIDDRPALKAAGFLTR
ncbi:MAG: small subunit ribosomal protein, partial [Pseudonocardiales bacterium]|nr:small subunit ribosomal protein [Pseudonocardiales bacterium]